MHCFVLQDFVTIRGASTITTVTQSAVAWLDAEPFQDLVAWLDVKEVSPLGATVVTLTYETSPTADDSLFMALGAGVTVSAVGLTISSRLIGSAASNPPLARFLRWKLTMSGTAAAWDITFRILLAANAPGPWAGRAAASVSGSRPNIDGGFPSTPVHLLEGAPATAASTRGIFTGLSARGGPPSNVAIGPPRNPFGGG